MYNFETVLASDPIERLEGTAQPHARAQMAQDTERQQADRHYWPYCPTLLQGVLHSSSPFLVSGLVSYGLMSL